MSISNANRRYIIAAMQVAINHLRATNAREALALSEALGQLRAEWSVVWPDPPAQLRMEAHWAYALTAEAPCQPTESQDQYEQRVLTTFLHRAIPADRQETRVFFHGCRHGVDAPLSTVEELDDDEHIEHASVRAGETVGVDYVAREVVRYYTVTIERSVVDFH